MEAFALPTLEPLAPVVAPPVIDPEALERERTQVIEAARQQGYADGLAAGRADAADQLRPAIAMFETAAAAVENERDTVSELVEGAAVELAIRIAEKILVGQLDTRPEMVLNVVRGALRRMIDRERVLLLVNPEDLDLVRARAPELVVELGGIEHLEVQAERRVDRGGAIVRTVEGEVDASVATKLERVHEVFSGCEIGRVDG